MNSNMIVVQFYDVDQTLMSANVFSTIVGQQPLGDVVDRLQEGYYGELPFLDYVDVH